MTNKERAIRILETAVVDFGLPPRDENCVSYNSYGFCRYIENHPLTKYCNKKSIKKIINLICNVDQTNVYWFTKGYGQTTAWIYKDLRYERRDFAVKRLKELREK